MKMVKTVIIDINLLFIRYVIYEFNNKMNEIFFFQLPWHRLSRKLGEYEVFE